MSCLQAVIVLFIICAVYGGGPVGSNSQNINNGDVYNIETEIVVNIFGDCEEYVHVSGKGIRDTFLASCTDDKVISIRSDDFLLYDNRYDSFRLFSDEPNRLVVIKGNQCILRMYTPYLIKWFPLRGDDCNEVMKRIVRKEAGSGMNAHHLMYFFKGVWKRLPPCFPFCSPLIFPFTSLLGPPPSPSEQPSSDPSESERPSSTDPQYSRDDSSETDVLFRVKKKGQEDNEQDHSKLKPTSQEEGAGSSSNSDEWDFGN